MKDIKHKELRKNQKVFVNRSINMAKIKAIGLDMDHTLAPYNRKEFEALAFRETLKKFINAGYPEELVKLKYRDDFLIRGLLVDRERGNVLKVDGHKYVKKAYHGHRALSKAERHRTYNSPGYKAEKFLSMDSFFALSEVQLFVEIVDYMNHNPGKIKRTYAEVYEDLRKFIDDSHRDGSIKDKVIAHPENYISRDKFIPKTLLRLINSGKFLFLLTNSHWEYTNEIMDYILSDVPDDEGFSNWKDYFSAIIVGGGKPGFFTGSQPFFEVMQDTGLLKICDGPLLPTNVYHGGNARLFEKLTGHRGDEILYIGDHIYGDIIQSKGILNWRTMLIVEELEQEIPKVEETLQDLIIIKEKIKVKEVFEEELQRLRSKIVANLRQMRKAENNQDPKKAHYLKKENEKHNETAIHLEKDLIDANEEIKQLIKKREDKIHPQWGELMKVGLGRSRFADQVNSYACIYSSKLSNLRYYSPLKRYESFHERMAHD